MALGSLQQGAQNMLVIARTCFKKKIITANLAETFLNDHF